VRDEVLFGAITLPLARVGLYGMVVYAVTAAHPRSGRGWRRVTISLENL
jgi:hypothetical protein